MTETNPVGAPAPADEGWHRLHPLSPLLRGGLFVLVIGGIILANLRDRLVALVFSDVPWAGESAESGDVINLLVERNLVLVAIVALLVVLALVVFFSWLGWRMHTYRITPDAVESRSGILFRQHRRAPLDRIQGVNLQRPMLARLLGLTMLEVATAGQDGKVKLNYLGHRDAKTVREQILAEVAARRAGATAQTVAAVPVAHAGQDPAPAAAPGHTVDPEPGADPALAAIPTVLADRAADFIDLDLDAGAGDSLVTVPPGRLIGATLLSWPTIVFGLGIVAIITIGITTEPILFVMLLPAGITFVGVTVTGFTRGMNFHLSLSDQGVRVSSGLISTVTETIPRGRIHAVEAFQPLGWRPFGWWHVRITTAGLSPTANGATKAIMATMLPVGKFDDVVRVLDVLLPGHGMTRDEVYEGMHGTSAVYLGSPKKAAWILWFSRRRNGLQVVPAALAEEPSLRLRLGWATRRLVLVPIVRMQSIELHRRPLHRLLGLAELTAHTVLGPVRTRISGLELADAHAAFNRVEAAAIEAAQVDVQQHAAARGTA